MGIESEPPGAVVYLDGENIGQTPTRVRVTRDEAHSVYLKKPGFVPQLVVLDLNRAPDGLLFLTPADVRVRLVGLVGSSDRDLQIEVDE